MNDFVRLDLLDNSQSLGIWVKWRRKDIGRWEEGISDRGELWDSDPAKREFEPNFSPEPAYDTRYVCG